MSVAETMTDAADTVRDRRTARRLLHRSRSVWVSIALGAAVAVAVLAIVESVLWALGRPPALVAPGTVRAVFTDGGPWAWIAAAAALVAGLLCLWGALAPGRTHRRLVESGRAPVVVDDGIIAGALSRAVAREAGVAPAQVSTRLGSRRAEIDVTPASGFPLDAGALQRAADAVLAAAGLESTVTARVRLSSEGKLS